MKKPRFMRRLFNSLILFAVLSTPLIIGILGGMYSVFDPQTFGVSYSEALVVRTDEYRDDIDRDPQYALSRHGEATSTLPLLFSGLFKLDRDGQVVPDLAEKWHISQDYLTYTITLRADATFGDGKTVTANDVAYTLKRAASSGTSFEATFAVRDIEGFATFRSNRGEFTGIREIDDRTIEIKLALPIQGFLYNLASHPLYIVDADDIDTNPTWYQRPNATGPYQVVEYEEGNYALLQRKDPYYGNVPSAKYVLFLYQENTEDISANDGYAKHLYDVVKLNIWQADEFQIATSPFYLELVTFKPWCYSAFQLNNKFIFTDIHMRRAFNASIERDVYAQLYYEGDAVVSRSVFSQGMPGYSEENDYAVFDEEYSRAQAQMSSIKSKEIWGKEYGFIDQSSAEYEIIGQMIRRTSVGVITVLKIEPNTTKNYENNPIAFSGFRRCNSNPDPAYSVNLLFLDYYNSGRDPSKFYQSYEAADVEPDPSKRIALFQELERQIMSEVPIAFTATPNDYYLVKPYVRGFNAIPGVALPVQEMSIDGKKFYLFTAMLRERWNNLLQLFTGNTD